MELTLEKEGVRVEWVDLGEGMCEEYNEDDPDDVPLLRFDVYLDAEKYQQFLGDLEPAWSILDDEWLAPSNSSYCTLMPVDTPEPVLMQALEELWQKVSEHGPEKRMLERFTYVEPWWYTGVCRYSKSGIHTCPHACELCRTDNCPIQNPEGEQSESQDYPMA